jgi:NAD binding domain of 6-phosphogluconate dehydrogenase
MAAADSRAGHARVAVLGTGIMGSAMARDLVAAGLPTTVWDRSPSVTEPLAEAGAEVAASPVPGGPGCPRGDHDAADCRCRGLGDLRPRRG